MSTSRRTKERYSFLCIEVTSLSASVDAGVNHKARDYRRYGGENLRVYRFDSQLELGGACTWPAETAGDQYSITVYGRPQGDEELDSTLKDHALKAADGTPRFRTRKGHQEPVYRLPEGIGLLQKRRGAPLWNGWVWVHEQTVSQMLTLASWWQPLFIQIHEHKVGRHRWINGLTLQTTDPAEE